MAESRIYPLIEVSREKLQALVEEPIARIDRVRGGFTNTLHKVRLASGASLAVKHYAAGVDAFGAELATLTLLHGTLPVPDVIYADEDERVIVYRWIEGITLDDLSAAGKREGFASIAEPLGHLLAWLARTDSTEAFELTPILERCYVQLSQGRARERLGVALATMIRKALEAHEPTLSWGTVCLAHGDLGSRNVIVQPTVGERWRISGVIDWETTTTGAPAVDLGSLFRHAHRFEASWIQAFAHGYREAGGELPEDWLRIARLLDATWLVDALDDAEESPGVFADCKMLLARLARDVTTG